MPQTKTAAPTGEAAVLIFRSEINSVRHHIGDDAAGRISRLGNLVVVIARNDDRVTGRVNTADDADMTAAATRHHRDGADLRAGDAMAILRIGAGEVAAAFMAGLFQHHVHEGAAPQAVPPGGVAAEVPASFGDQIAAAE